MIGNYSSLQFLSDDPVARPWAVVWPTVREVWTESKSKSVCHPHISEHSLETQQVLWFWPLSDHWNHISQIALFVRVKVRRRGLVVHTLAGWKYCQHSQKNTTITSTSSVGTAGGLQRRGSAGRKRRGELRGVVFSKCFVFLMPQSTTGYAESARSMGLH